MHNVTRYDKGMDGYMEPEEYGDWVRFEDAQGIADKRDLFRDHLRDILSHFPVDADEYIRKERGLVFLEEIQRAREALK